MKLPKTWGSKTRKTKAKVPSLPIRGKVVKISDFQKKSDPGTIQQIRSQGQILASRGLGQGVRSHSSEKESTQDTTPLVGRGKSQGTSRNHKSQTQNAAT